MADPLWCPVAGRAACDRSLEDRVQPASPLVRRRHAGWVLDALRAEADVAEGPEWTIGVDGAVVRAHQHAAGARRVPPADIPAEVVATAELDTGGVE